MDIEQILNNPALRPEDITKMVCSFLISIVEETFVGDGDEFPEVSFPDSIIDIVFDMLGERCISFLKDKIKISDSVISDVVNNTEWLTNDLLPEIYEFIKFHLNYIKFFESQKCMRTTSNGHQEPLNHTN